MGSASVMEAQWKRAGDGNLSQMGACIAELLPAVSPVEFSMGTPALEPVHSWEFH
jgi:hypothetical protein